MKWLTNSNETKRMLSSLYGPGKGNSIFIGPPSPIEGYTLEELREMGLYGVYKFEDADYDAGHIGYTSLYDWVMTPDEKAKG